MMLVAFDWTFVMVAPMLAVVSERNTMSGLGGIGGVTIALGMTVLPPSGRVRFTVVGVTPGPVARATERVAVMLRAANSAANRRRKPTRVWADDGFDWIIASPSAVRWVLTG